MLPLSLSLIPVCGSTSYSSSATRMPVSCSYVPNRKSGSTALAHMQWLVSFLMCTVVAQQACTPGADVSAVSSARAARTSASVSRFRPRRRASSKPLKRKVVCRSPLGMWQEPHCQLGPAPVPSCSKHSPLQHLTSCKLARICSTSILRTSTASKFAVRTSCRQGQFKHGLQQHVCQEINLSAFYYCRQAWT